MVTILPAVRDRTHTPGAACRCDFQSLNGYNPCMTH